jgi:hypothetical protein
MGAGNFDAPVIKRASVAAARAPRPVSDIILAPLPESAPMISAPASIALLDFQDRFGAAAPQSVAPKPIVEAPKLAAAASSPVDAPKPRAISSPAQVAALTPAPAPAMGPTENKTAKGAGASVKDMAQRAKAAVMSVASNEKLTMVEKLWGKGPSHGSLLAFASADANVTGSVVKEQNPMLGGSAPYDRETAVYDIAAKTVYLPDGTKLEAHSGLGSKMDDVRYAHVRMQGVTPPHIYELKPREALFHGVPALRLTPIGGEDKIFGRTGLLAHTYMLGPNGDSNGCVSFKDYYAFLNAYKNRGIRKLAVVARVP